MIKPIPLCTLPNGRVIFPGDGVYRTHLQVHVTAESVWVDYEGDEYLTFYEGGNAWIGGPSDFTIKLL